jgi:hypothetical protein
MKQLLFSIFAFCMVISVNAQDTCSVSTFELLNQSIEFNDTGDPWGQTLVACTSGNMIWTFPFVMGHVDSDPSGPGGGVDHEYDPEGYVELTASIRDIESGIVTDQLIIFDELLFFSSLGPLNEDLYTTVDFGVVEMGKSYEVFFAVGPDDLASVWNSPDVNGYACGHMTLGGINASLEMVFQSYIEYDCPEDLSGDGKISTEDLITFLTAYGTVCGACQEDFNNDGLVNITDLLQMLQIFGQFCYVNCI